MSSRFLLELDNKPMAMREFIIIIIIIIIIAIGFWRYGKCESIHALQIDDDKGCQVWLVEEESFVDLAQEEDDGV